MSSKRKQSTFGQNVSTSAVIVGVLFLVKSVEVLFQIAFEQYGIAPRTQSGLLGIVFSPLLHANIDHLLANSLPLFVLLILLLSNPQYRPWQTIALIWIASGLGTWIIGRGDAIHIGASSIIFGLASFLIASGFHLRNWRAILVGILVFVLYGGIFYGIIPRADHVSWEGHLCGAIAGILAARYIKN